MSERRIALSDLTYDAAEEQAVLDVLRSKWLSSGPQVQAFEAEFAARVGAASALAVSSATAALHLALAGLDIGPGDEVIQPAINFVAAANMTVATGATPVFADISALDEPVIDPTAIERLITPRTKAVVVMYYGGYFGRTPEIVDLCRQRGLLLIEDACHAVGARCTALDDRPAGGIGDVACFSFFSNKNLATGEGGMVTTSRPDLAERLRLLRSHGMTTMTWQRDRGHASSYDVLVHGYNYRLDEIRAALGRVQLGKLDANNARRRAAVDHYRRRLAGLTGWTVPFANSTGDSACHLMVVVAPDALARAAAAAALKAAGVQTSLHYPSVPTFQAFERFAHADLPLSDQYGRLTLTLPLHPGLSADDLDYVCDVLQEAAAARPAKVPGGTP
ncbi:MAG: DegT/DnrJ/EryC1/StrS family aminotransferase [Vicinamibacterales bacterium]